MNWESHEPTRRTKWQPIYKRSVVVVCLFVLFVLFCFVLLVGWLVGCCCCILSPVWVMQRMLRVKSHIKYFCGSAQWWNPRFVYQHPNFLELRQNSLLIQTSAFCWFLPTYPEGWDGCQCWQYHPQFDNKMVVFQQCKPWNNGWNFWWFLALYQQMFWGLRKNLWKVRWRSHHPGPRTAKKAVLLPRGSPPRRRDGWMCWWLRLWRPRKMEEFTMFNLPKIGIWYHLIIFIV